MFTRIATKRRDFLKPHADASILEIGAFDNPTFRREAGDAVEYLDYFSRDELCEMHKGNPRRKLDASVEVDYVVKNRDFAIKVDRRFELIVANHVIEHVPDTIYWLNQLGSLLKPDGKIFLAIPDRRYTFDYFRQESRATEMLRAHDESLERPSVWQLADSFYYHQKVKLEDLWAGRRPSSFKPRFSLAEAMRMAREKSAVYTDAHCWCFTPDSFAQCMVDLNSAGAIALKAVEIKPPLNLTNEFWALLR